MRTRQVFPRRPSKERWSIGTLLVTGLVLVCGVSPAFAKGGQGLVTAYHVGPLDIDTSSPPDVRGFAGPPDSTSFFNNGAGTEFMIFEYRFPFNGFTAYTFAGDGSGGWTLEQFQTTLQRFRTAHGTRVGMSVREAERREHLPFRSGCYSGLIRRWQGGQFNLILESSLSRVGSLYAQGPNPPPC
jgi:hypothetical protein